MISGSVVTLPTKMLDKTEEVTNLKVFGMKEDFFFMKEDSLPSSEPDNTRTFSGQEGVVKEEDVN